MTKKRLYDDFLQATVYLVFNASWKEVEKLSANICVEHPAVEEKDRQAKAMVREGTESRWLIYIRVPETGTIEHECVHLKNYIFEYKGLQLDTDNDEADPYYIDMWVRKIKKAMKC